MPKTPKATDLNSTYSNLVQTGQGEAALKFLRDNPRFFPTSTARAGKDGPSYTPAFWACIKGLEPLKLRLTNYPYSSTYIPECDDRTPGKWFTTEGFKHLVSIIDADDTEAFKAALSIGTFPYESVIDTEGLTLTSYLAKLGKLDMLEIVITTEPEALEAGSTLIRHNHTPLMAAAEAGQTKTVAYLLGKGAEKKEEARDLAEAKGHEEIVDLIESASNKLSKS